MNIGILGGSFNPVHIGHLRLAVEVLEQLGLDRVELVPANVPPHKASAGLLPFAERLRLLELAVSDYDGLVVNALEGERDGPSYTVDTLHLFQKRHPNASFCFILGTRDFLSLPTWHRWQELLTLTDFSVVSREGEGLEEVEAFLNTMRVNGMPPRTGARTWELAGGSKVHSLVMPRLDISSTLLRNKLDKGLSVTWLVPAAMEREVVRLWQTRQCHNCSTNS